jgi:hypothetical protein
MSAFADLVPKKVKVMIDGEVFAIRRKHPYLRAMRCLARAAQKKPGVKRVPRRRDTRTLWGQMDSPKQQLLHTIAKHPLHKMTQTELQDALGLDSLGLRVIHQSMARICESRGFDRPIRSTGYSAENRSYVMDDDVAATIMDCWRRSPSP